MNKQPNTNGIIEGHLKLFKKLEWSGITSGPSTGMGLDNGPDVKNCPYCHGIYPKDDWADCYNVTGHTKRCALHKAIKECEKILTK